MCAEKLAELPADEKSLAPIPSVSVDVAPPADRDSRDSPIVSRSVSPAVSVASQAGAAADTALPPGVGNPAPGDADGAGRATLAHARPTATWPIAAEREGPSPRPSTPNLRGVLPAALPGASPAPQTTSPTAVPTADSDRVGDTQTSVPRPVSGPKLARGVLRVKHFRYVVLVLACAWVRMKLFCCVVVVLCCVYLSF